MKNFLALFSRTPLFLGAAEADLERILSCLQAQETQYLKKERILSPGTVSRRFGIVLSGSVRICREDSSGNGMLLAQLFPGDLFAEAFACAGQPLTVAAEAAEAVRILWIDSRKMLAFCGKACPAHALAAENLLQILAQKNIFLTDRIQHLSCRSLREKVWSFLSEQAVLAKNSSFAIPFNRQQMADYLAADRSALSAVLCRMQEEGLLRFHKNRFTLL